jgi:microcystin-dependent protein
MAQPFVGDIRIFGGNFAPVSYLKCAGQLLAISQYDTLFTILGTMYGGDGVQTFQLPDLQGRVPMGTGQAPGLTNRVVGQVLGEENHQLTSAEMPQHTHTLNAVASGGNQPGPGGGLLAASDQRNSQYSNSTTNTTMGPSAISFAGSNAAHNNVQPSLAVNFIIALFGVYPSRN